MRPPLAPMSPRPVDVRVFFRARKRFVSFNLVLIRAASYGPVSYTKMICSLQRRCGVRSLVYINNFRQKSFWLSRDMYKVQRDMNRVKYDSSNR